MASAAERSRAVGRRRHLARLAAVQALYQIEMTGQRPETVVLEFLKHRQVEEIDGISLAGMDQSLFNELTLGTAREEAQLDGFLTNVLSEDWPLGRLARLLRVILRLGAYELKFRPAVPVGAVVNEWVELAHSYFDGKEPGMVNGVLDRLSQTLRGSAEGSSSEAGAASKARSSPKA